MKYFRHNGGNRLDDALFRSPTNEYRGAPFWAWNSALVPDQLREQIDIFKEMGFGGFNMHVRQGLETPYLEKEFMDAVRACCEKADAEDMYAWAYDEDRWPSGCAGGLLTKEIKYRTRFLLMTVKRQEDETSSPETALSEGKPYLLAAFDVRIGEDGIMTSFKRIEPNAEAENKRYFYCMTKPGGEPRFNYQSYADTLSKQAMDKFIEMTYGAYKREVGEHFGKSLPAFFTDEPQMCYAHWPMNGFSDENAVFPFTPDLPDTFMNKNGYDLTDMLPHLCFASSGDEGRRVRYDYWSHVSERFCMAYSDNIGDWCEKNGVMLSGHAVGEDSLREQTVCGYETMRLYKNMQLPGIDSLFGDKNFTTALQCRSVVNQYGREGMLSELYGVTNWDFDFRGHKFHGDWQACLGVTVRCQHLAWQSMKGEGKRDYPASIFYQSPWYKEYRYVEDHFARLNTALTRGICATRIAVVHPIGTYWMEKASSAETGTRCDELDRHFSELAEWLITAMADFDYLSESLLPELCERGENPLRVGKMSYDAVIVPDCVTLRSHTLRVLEEFKAAGGKLIFIGPPPRMCDALSSERASALADGCDTIPFSKSALRDAVLPFTNVELRDENGERTEHFMHTERVDGDRRWLFFAHTAEGELKQRSYGNALTVKVKGVYLPKIYDTLTGEIKTPDFEHKNGCTLIYAYLYDRDSLLLSLDITENTVSRAAPAPERIPVGELACPRYADFTLSEPNVLLLDMAEYSLDGAPFEPTEEILRIDGKVRRSLGYVERKTKVVQPYVILDAPEDHTLTLRYTVVSEADFDGVSIALENAEKCSISLNGREIALRIGGWYIDKDVRTVPLGRLCKGDNVITVTMPLGVRTDIEACYLLGNFAVRCFGSQPTLYPMPEKLYFGDAGVQGLRFYGGNLSYVTEIDLDADCDLECETSYYIGALVKVTLDGERSEAVAYSPYRALFTDVKKGRHTLTFTVFGNRYNTLSALHATVSDMHRLYNGPAYWRTEGDAFSYEYNFRPFGIMKTPVIRKLRLTEGKQRTKPTANRFYNMGTLWSKY